MEAGGVGLMLGKRCGEIVMTAEIFLGTEIEIVGVLVLQNGIDRGCGGYADGSRRETGMHIGVVGTVGEQHIGLDTLDGKVAYGKFDGGVGLQGHIDMQSVKVDGGDIGFFVIGIGLFFNDGGKGDDLLTSEVELCQLAFTLFPKTERLLVHLVQQFVGRDVPIVFVCVLRKHADDGLRGFAVTGADSVGKHKCQKGVGGKFQFGSKKFAELFHGAVAVDGDAYGVLVAGIKLLYERYEPCVWVDEVAARFDVLVESAKF